MYVMTYWVFILKQYHCSGAVGSAFIVWCVTYKPVMMIMKRVKHSITDVWLSTVILMTICYCVFITQCDTYKYPFPEADSIILTWWHSVTIFSSEVMMINLFDCVYMSINIILSKLVTVWLTRVYYSQLKMCVWWLSYLCRSEIPSYSMKWLIP